MCFDRRLCEAEVPEGSLPDCEFHDLEPDPPPLAEYDAKVKWDTGWAFMCEPCFERIGLGLGPGLGARLIAVRRSEE